MENRPSPTPEDMGKINEATRIAGMLPYLKIEVERMVKTLETRVYHDIQDGSLTPEAALGAWMERLAYHRLISRFEQRVNIGQLVGGRVNIDILTPDDHIQAE